MSRYIFYYYWSHDLRPCPAKALEEEGFIVGGAGKATEYKWEISKEDYLTTNLVDLVGRFPWPNPEDK